VKSTRQAHFAHPWRVHTLAADFELLDVWRFEVRLDERRGFDAFLETYWEAIHAVERSPLSRMRVAIGRVMGWDAAPNSRPIPGCVEHLVAERLDAADRARNRFAADEPSPLPVAKVRPVYRFDDEALWEVSERHRACADARELRGGGCSRARRLHQVARALHAAVHGRHLACPPRDHLPVADVAGRAPLERRAARRNGAG